MQSFQPRYVKTQILGFTIEKPAPDPRVKVRHRRNRGRKKLSSLLATINGIGLKNVELLNKVANNAYGMIPPTHSTTPRLRKNANKEQRQEWRKSRIRTEIPVEPNQLNNYAMGAIDLIRENPFRNPEHVSVGPNLSREGERDRGKISKDYSAFPQQKRSKAAYKAAKGRRAVVATPRQSTWTVPPKYAAPKAAEQATAVTEAQVRLNLKPVVGK